MNELISVVVPIYNVESYLDKCIATLREQTYKSLEFILIDDCSTDNSLSICREAVKTDSRFKLVELEKNGGVSNARNLGIEKATGEYIIFVDSDDWLELDMIEILYENIKKSGADISACDYYCSYEASEVEHNDYELEEIILDKKKKYDYLFSEEHYSGYLWNKLISRELIMKSGARFDKDVVIWEDLLFLCVLFEDVQKVIYSPSNKLYHHRCRSNSLINFKYSLKDLTKLTALKYFLDNGFDYEKIVYEYFILKCQSKYILKKYDMLDSEVLEKIDAECRKYYKRAYNYAKGLGRIRVILWNLFPVQCGAILDKNK